jgi:hypothetical protein
MSHENVQESLGTRTLKDGSVHRMRGRALHYVVTCIIIRSKRVDCPRWDGDICSAA